MLVLFLILISAIISAFGTVVGFGGGIFLVPILVSIFDYKLATAVGTVMFALVPSSMLTTWFNRKSGHTDFKMGVLLELPTVAGTVLGSYLLYLIATRELEIIFALMVLVLGVSFFVKNAGKTKEEQGIFFRLNRLAPSFQLKNAAQQIQYRVSLWLLLFFGGLAGTIAGLFGVGGGFLKTPILIKVFKMPAKIAASTALFMILITSTVGTISHYLFGHISLIKSWPVMIGFVLGAILGRTVNTKLDDSALEKLIGVALILSALVMMSQFLKQLS